MDLIQAVLRHEDRIVQERLLVAKDKEVIRALAHALVNNNITATSLINLKIREDKIKFTSEELLEMIYGAQCNKESEENQSSRISIFDYKELSDEYRYELYSKYLAGKIQVEN